jgi:hypothetical protein
MVRLLYRSPHIVETFLQIHIWVSLAKTENLCNSPRPIKNPLFRRFFKIIDKFAIAIYITLTKKYTEAINQSGKFYPPYKVLADLLSLLEVKEQNKDLDGCSRTATFEFLSSNAYLSYN